MPTQEDWQNNPYQFNLLDYTTSTEEGDTQAVGYSPRYLTDMLQRQDLVEQGRATPWERQLQQNQVQAAQQVPMRDPRTLQYNAGEQDATTLSGGSPDLGRLMLGLRQRMQQGTATPQERELFGTTLRNLSEQTYRSVVPQASDANAFGMGNNLFDALGILALGASGGLAGGALAAGGAGLGSTLGSLGTLAGTAGTGASVLGQATDQEWLQKLGMGLGAAGGIAGGVGGLANLAGSGVQSLSDAARLASNAGRVVGGVGAITDQDALKQAGGWLGTAGQLGGGVENLRNLLGGTGGSLQGVMGLLKPLQRIAGQFMQPGGQRPETGQGTQAGPRPVATAPQRPMSMEPAAQGSPPSSGTGPSGIQSLLQAAQQARQRGGPLTDQDWLRQDWRLRNPAARSVLSNL